MITIIYENGELAGQRHKLSPGGCPQYFISSLVEASINWQLKYTDTPFACRQCWHVADIATRIDRALQDRKPVYLNSFKCRSVLQLVIIMSQSQLSSVDLNMVQDDELGLVLTSI